VGTHTALIVDDDEDMRWLVRATIDLSDELTIEAEEATGAEEALTLWRAEHHDLVVVDYRMPGANGLDLAEAILAERPEQDVILFSAYLDDQTMARAEELGVRGCVSKERIREIPRILRHLIEG
jgi:two-component system response regulator DesR